MSKETLDVIYQILKRLEEAMDEENFDYENINHEALGISETRWVAIIEMMQENNLIKGLKIHRSADGLISISTNNPRITLQGIEYLVENSQFNRIVKAAKLIKDIAPGL